MQLYGPAFLFYLSETREVANLLLLPTETGAEPHRSCVTTCHLNTEAVRDLKKTSSHLILHMPTLATTLFYTVVCWGGSIKKRDILALCVAFVISIQSWSFFFFFFKWKVHRAKQHTSINSIVYLHMIIVHLLTEALTVCFFFSFLGSMWATTTSGHCDASSLMERKHSSFRHMTTCLSSRISTHTQFNTRRRDYQSRYLFMVECTVIKQYL